MLRVANGGGFLKDGSVVYRVKYKLTVEKPHLTNAQKMNSVRIFPFQMECLNISTSL